MIFAGVFCLWLQVAVAWADQKPGDVGVQTVTAYCHCAACCGEAGMPTASGVLPAAGVTGAGPRWVAFGTRVWIEGVGYRTVQDRLHPQYDDRWDIFVADHAAARAFGKQQRRITLEP